MSELIDGDVDGTVCRTVGFEVVRNDHRERIADYCREHGANFLQLLGLYVHMASKPDGWKFSYRRLSKELPGVGDSAVRALLQHMAALGYYTVTNHRGDDGHFLGEATFDAGNAWPAQSTVRQSTVRRNPTHGDSGVKLTDGDETTAQTVRWLPGPGSPKHGGPTHLVSTEVVSTESQSSQQPRNGQAPTAQPAHVDLTEEKKNSSPDSVGRYLDDLERLTGLQFQRNGQARQAVATAWRLGHPTAATALDAMTRQGHSVERAGAGLILRLLTQLPDAATARAEAARERNQASARAAQRRYHEPELLGNELSRYLDELGLRRKPRTAS